VGVAVGVGEAAPEGEGVADGRVGTGAAAGVLPGADDAAGPGATVPTCGDAAAVALIGGTGAASGSGAGRHAGSSSATAQAATRAVTLRVVVGTRSL